MPSFYWTQPRSLRDLPQRDIPAAAGCFVLTDGPGPLASTAVLHVGAARESLRDEISSYLVAYRRPMPSHQQSSSFMLAYRAERQSLELYVRWISGAQASRSHAELVERLDPWWARPREVTQS